MLEWIRINWRWLLHYYLLFFSHDWNTCAWMPLGCMYRCSGCYGSDRHIGGDVCRHAKQRILNINKRVWQCDVKITLNRALLWFAYLFWRFTFVFCCLSRRFSCFSFEPINIQRQFTASVILFKLKVSISILLFIIFVFHACFMLNIQLYIHTICPGRIWISEK